ncbi:MAG: membrane protein of unknown function [Candidatus Thorarchaeota archaeon]|nr:MAG: membrane protein of unknown function [Candidatus Thorarchaeota archaeon]
MSKLLRKSENIESSKEEKVLFLFCIILNIIVRIPRVPRLLGDDAFLVYTQGMIIGNGFLENLFLSPFAIFGLYPFNTYPAGIPILISIFQKMNFGLEVSVFILSILLGLVSFYGAFKLGNFLFVGGAKSYIYAGFYSLGAPLLEVSYSTIHPRAALLAVAPFFLLTLLKFSNTPNISNFTKTIISYTILLLTHQVVIFLLIYPIGLFIFHFKNKLTNIIRNIVKKCKLYSTFNIMSLIGENQNKHVITLFNILLLIAVSFSSLVLGLIFLPGRFLGQTMINMENANIIDLIIVLGKYHFIEIGCLIILIYTGIYKKVYPISTKSIFHIGILVFISLGFIQGPYFYLVLWPILVYYIITAIFTSDIEIALTILAVNFMIYQLIILVITLSFWILIPFSLTISLFVFYFIKNNEFKYNIISSFDNTGFKYVLLIIFALTSCGFIDSFVATDSMYLSEDEQVIIDFLKTNYNEEIVFVYSHRIGRRLEAFGFRTIISFNFDSTLYYGWTTPESIHNKTKFNLFSIFRTGKFFEFEGYNPEWDYWSTLVDLDLSNESQYNQSIQIGLRYIVVEIENNQFCNQVYLQGNLISSSKLLASVIDNGILCIRTNNMALFQLY